MNPDQFTTNADAWTAAIEHVALTVFAALVGTGIAAAAAYVKLKPFVDKLKADIEANKGRIDQHDATAGVMTTPTATFAAGAKVPPISVTVPQPSTPQTK